MNTKTLPTPEFIEGFTSYCFDKGFDDKHTSELLKQAAVQALVSDEDFQEGMFLELEGMKKSAWFRALRAPVAGGVAGGIAGGIGGATLGNDQDNGMSAMRKILTGAAAGATLGALPKAKSLLSKANPFFSRPGGFGVDIVKPLTAPFKVKGLAKGLGVGGIAGAAAGGGYELAGRVRDYLSDGKPNFDYTSLMPGYIQSGPGGGYSSGGGGGGNIFSMPNTLRDVYTGGGSMGAGASGGWNPMSELKSAQANLKNIDQSLIGLQQRIASLRPGNSLDKVERIHIEKQIANLKSQRDAIVKDSGGLLSRITSDTQNGISQAQELAGYHGNRESEITRKLDRLMKAREGGFLDQLPYILSGGSLFGKESYKDQLGTQIDSLADKLQRHVGDRSMSEQALEKLRSFGM